MPTTHIPTTPKDAMAKQQDTKSHPKRYGKGKPKPKHKPRKAELDWGITRSLQATEVEYRHGRKVVVPVATQLAVLLLLAHHRGWDSTAKAPTNHVIASARKIADHAGLHPFYSFRGVLKGQVRALSPGANPIIFPVLDGFAVAKEGQKIISLDNVQMGFFGGGHDGGSQFLAG